MLGYPLTPPLGTLAADPPTHLPPPPSRPPKVLAPGCGLEFEQDAPLCSGNFFVWANFFFLCLRRTFSRILWSFHLYRFFPVLELSCRSVP